MSVRPVFANRSIKSIFIDRGIGFFSFCSPSRGPTSTILTRLPVEDSFSDRPLRGSTAVAKHLAVRRETCRGQRDANIRNVCIVTVDVKVHRVLEVVEARYD
jgi:hypothetical protein